MVPSTSRALLAQDLVPRGALAGFMHMFKKLGLRMVVQHCVFTGEDCWVSGTTLSQQLMTLWSEPFLSSQAE